MFACLDYSLVPRIVCAMRTRASKPTGPKHLLSFAEAAKVVGASRRSIYRWVEEDGLRCVTVRATGRRRIRLGDLRRFIEMSPTKAELQEQYESVDEQLDAIAAVVEDGEVDDAEKLGAIVGILYESDDDDDSGDGDESGAADAAEVMETVAEIVDDDRGGKLRRIRKALPEGDSEGDDED